MKDRGDAGEPTEAEEARAEELRDGFWEDDDHLAARAADDYEAWLDSLMPRR